MTVEFWVTSIVLTATPGTGVLYTVAAAVRGGLRIGLLAAFGCTVGILPHLALAVAGAGALVAASPVAFEVLKWLGVAYLLYLAWGLWHPQDHATTDARSPSQGSAGALVTSAVLVNLLNPKLTMFFLVFLPMFVDPTQLGAALVMAQLGAELMGITLVIFAGYALLASRFTEGARLRPRTQLWISRAFAMTFVGLALALAVARL